MVGEFALAISTALIGGASAAVKGITTDAIQAAYTALKSRLIAVKPDVPVQEIENAIAQGEPLEQVYSKLSRARLDPDDQDLKRLVAKLCAELDRLKSDLPKAAGDVTLPLPAILEEDDKIGLVQGLPIGPSVRGRFFSADKFSVAMERAMSAEAPLRSRIVVDRANALRRAADPDLPEESICLNDLPSLVGTTGLADFWYIAADQAGRRGPRMVASLLLVAPMSVWYDYGAQAFSSLTSEVVP